MSVKCFLIFSCAFLLSLIFINAFKKFSIRNQLFISKGVSLVGGMGMGLSFTLVSLTGLMLSRSLSRETGGIIVCSLLMLVFGIMDDRHELSIRAKFLLQLIATGLLILLGARTKIVYIGIPLNILITFIWVIGITNAFNHLDVMDGAAGGCAFLISGTFFIIGVFRQDIGSAVLSLSLAGAAFSFFLCNFPPAKVYMGNSGSHFLGFALASIALIISYAPMERKIALMTPLLILGLPIFDTTFLILARSIKKNLPFKKSNDHLVLKFLSLVGSKRKALEYLFVLCLFFCLCGLLVSQVSNFLGGLVVACIVLISLRVALKMLKVSTDV
ncbi:MAG: MraY family glycosyltransferase [Candidatus Omnitrophota bacterium]